MKKLLVIFILVGLLVGCNNPPVTKTDAQKFKEEMEALNDVAVEGAEEGTVHVSLTIPEENPMKYATGTEVIEMLKNGTGVIYFGFPECPWCRSALPVFLDIADAELMTEVLYYNNLDQRDIKELDESGQVVETKAGTEEYFEILALLGEYASEYGGLNNPDIKRLYFPTYVFVKEGKIVGTHVGTLSGISNPRASLTEEQIKELSSIYLDLFAKIKEVCDNAC